MGAGCNLKACPELGIEAMVYGNWTHCAVRTSCSVMEPVPCPGVDTPQRRKLRLKQRVTHAGRTPPHTAPSDARRRLEVEESVDSDDEDENYVPDGEEEDSSGEASSLSRDSRR